MEFTDRYCTVALAKELCADITGTEDDQYIKVLIGAASRIVDKYTGYYWGPSATISAERVASIMGRDSDCFYTKYAPVISVTSLADDTVTYVEDTDYVVFYDEGRIQILNNSLAATIKSFSDTPGALRITYVAGRGAAKTGEYVQGVAAPPDVQLATAIIVGSLYAEDDRSGIASRARNQDSVTFRDDEIPAKARMILRQRIRPIC